MVVHVSLYAHWFSPIGKHVFLHHKFDVAALQLIESIAKLVVKHLLAVLFEKIEVTVLAAQEHCAIHFEQVLQDFAFVHFHAREYLFTHETRLNLVEGCTIDKPGHVDGHWITLVSRGILSHVVR